LDGRNIDVDMEEAKELQQNIIIIKKLNEGVLMPDNVHDLLDLLEMR
jgi:hypothetical protein